MNFFRDLPSALAKFPKFMAQIFMLIQANLRTFNGFPLAQHVRTLQHDFELFRSALRILSEKSHRTVFGARPALFRFALITLNIFLGSSHKRGTLKRSRLPFANECKTKTFIINPPNPY